MTRHTATHVGLIGPNAITQVMASLHDRLGDVVARSFFESAGLASYFHSPPHEMVPEADVRKLHMHLRRSLPPAMVKVILRDAGLRTGRYILAHRIPKLAQMILKFLPADWAGRILASAISKHAWTFAGSGLFKAQAGTTFVFSIQNNPLCRQFESSTPSCDYYAATFEQIFRSLVHPFVTVQEICCEAMGAEACVFEIRW